MKNYSDFDLDSAFFQRMLNQRGSYNDIVTFTFFINSRSNIIHMTENLSDHNFDNRYLE